MRMSFSRAWSAKQEERQSRMGRRPRVMLETQRNGNERIINVNPLQSATKLFASDLSTAAQFDPAKCRVSHVSSFASSG